MREREVRERECVRETQSCKYRHCLELGPDCSAAVERETEKQRERERASMSRSWWCKRTRRLHHAKRERNRAWNW